MAGQGGVGGDAITAPVLVLTGSSANEPNALYALPLHPAAASLRVLSHALPPGSSVLSFSVSPTGARVAFTASAADVAALDVYVVDVDGTNMRKVSPDGLANGLGSILGWSPSGASLAFHQDGHYYAVRVDGSARVELPSRDITWTHDEASVVYADGLRVMKAGLDGSNPQPIAVANNLITIQGWSSEGGWLMTASGSPRGPVIQAWNSSGTDVHDLPSSPLGQFPSWSPRSEGVYAWLASTGYAQLSSVDGTVAAEFDAIATQRVSWSPDGTWVALSGAELVLSPAPPNAERPVLHIEGKSPANRAPAFVWSQDSRYIAYAATMPQSTSEELFVRALDAASTPVRVSGTAAAGSTIRSFSWSPRGRFVTYQADHRRPGTDELALTELATDRHVIIGEVDDLSWPADDSAWSRDGRFLVFELDGKLKVLDCESFVTSDLQARLPSGVQSIGFEFGVEPLP